MSKRSSVPEAHGPSKAGHPADGQDPRGRRSRRSYTVLIVPHARSQFRKLHVSAGFVLSVCLVGILTLLAGLSAPHLLMQVQTRASEIDRLSHENERLAQEKDAIEAAVSDLNRTLDRYETQAQHIAEALGVDDPAGDAMAAGGPSEAAGAAVARPLLDAEIGALQLRASRLGRSMEALDEAFEARLSVLNSTPSLTPVGGWFSDGFGWRKDPITGKRLFHKGIDIVADAGTPIVAPADGIVTRATRLADYGKTVDIAHGHGFVTRYGHMSELLVRPGQQLKRGDLIGRVGSTGRSTGPHLHYELFRDGRRVNPWKYLGQK